MVRIEHRAVPPDLGVEAMISGCPGLWRLGAGFSSRLETEVRLQLGEGLVPAARPRGPVTRPWPASCVEMCFHRDRKQRNKVSERRKKGACGCTHTVSELCRVTV